MVDDLFTFEIGEKNKSTQQISRIENALLVADDIESGVNNKVPLWLSALLY